MRKQASDAASRLESFLGSSKDEESAALIEQVEGAAAALTEKLTAVENELVQTKNRSLEDPLNHPGKLTAHLAYVHTVANSGSDSPPTAATRERLADLDAQLAEVYGRLDGILKEDVAAFNELVAGAELPTIVLPPAP